MNIRDFKLDDIEGLNALRAEAAWAPLSKRHWEWQLENPSKGDKPVGWVMEKNGLIDGFVGNFIQTYYRGDEVLHAATGHEILVSKRSRGAASRIIRTFIAQDGIFAAGTLNANTLSAPIHRKLGLTAFPTETGHLKLSWTLSPLTLAVARLHRALRDRKPDLSDKLGEQFTPHRAARFDARNVKWNAPVEPITDMSDDSDYGRFWERLRAQGRLLADRSPAVMRWRISDPVLVTAPLLLGWRTDDGIVAYGMAQLSKMAAIDTPVLEIIDLQYLDSAPAEALPDLIDALKLAGRKMGASKVRLHVLTNPLKERLGRQLDDAREEGGWGHGHVDFKGPLEDYLDWRPTPFDGCYSYNLRQPLIKTAYRPTL